MPWPGAPGPERRPAQGSLPKALHRAQELYDAGQMTVKEISAAVGASPTTLYGHSYEERDKKSFGLMIIKAAGFPILKRVIASAAHI